jgi:thiopurine S-methyltransferase
LWKQGFKNIFVLDIASEPLSNLKRRIPGLPESQIIQTDFFTHNETYDIILEQTFFCALEPKLRVAYRDHMFRILAVEGRLAGVLFDFPLSNEGPPFGGSLKGYRELFQGHFKIKTLEPCYNSEPSRAGKELFFIFGKN